MLLRTQVLSRRTESRFGWMTRMRDWGRGKTHEKSLDGITDGRISVNISCLFQLDSGIRTKWLHRCSWTDLKCLRTTRYGWPGFRVEASDNKASRFSARHTNQVSFLLRTRVLQVSRLEFGKTFMHRIVFIRTTGPKTLPNAG